MTDAQKKTRTNPRTAAAILVAALFLMLAYLLGAYSFSRDVWPISWIRAIKRSMPWAPPLDNFDKFWRLTKYQGKVEVECPAQTPDTGVLLAIGQSNSANHAEKRMTTSYPQHVVNYYAGKCYVAASPLLGASGDEGEFITPLADRLVSDGIYKSVVIVSSGINGTPIARWQKDGDLNEMLMATLVPLQNKYRITEIIWHQGEADFTNSTSSKVYATSFTSMLGSLRAAGIDAPAYISVATKCDDDPRWALDNPAAMGQKSLANGTTIVLAANTDTLLATEDRREDQCHFSASGQLKAANAYADAIRTHRQKLHATR